MPDETKEAATDRPKPTIHPKELSPEYHKAHKQLMLWAAILFIWEFVGIDLEKAKDAEGYAGALVKSIKSPQAVPWVLLALVFYFLFKCSTEWAQCHLDRRKLRFARADFVSAWIVAVAAIALYIGQRISSVQLADVLSGRSVLWFFYGLIVGGVFVGATFLLLKFKEIPKKNRPRLIRLVAFFFLITIVAFGFAIQYSSKPASLLTGLVVGLIGEALAFKLFFERIATLRGLKLSSSPKN